MYLSKRMDELRTELIHRFELLGNDLKTIRTKMVAFNKLTVYMLENNICEYTVDVGNAFIAFNESERGKCLGVIQSLNDCLTNNPWWFLNNVHSSYTISNSRVKECAERILQEMQTLQYKRASLSYTYLCYCRLDLYMIENQYTDYSADIGEKFLDGVKNVIPENQVRYFPYKYILPIKQLNEFISGGIGTFRIPDDYEFKNSTLKSACDDLTALLTSLNYTKSALSTHQTSLKLLDWYMCVKRISTYNEEVGNLFVQYMEQRCTTPKTDGHNVYVRATVCRLNDLLNNRGYIRYHHDHCIEIPDEYHNLFVEYIQYCKDKGNKEGTIKIKTEQCERFFNTLIDLCCMSIEQISFDIVAKCCKIMSQNHWGVIREIIRYCYEKDLVSRDYSLIIPHQKKRIPLPTLFSREETLRLESTPDRNTPLGKRDYAIMLLINRLGLRSSDVANLSLENIGYHDGTIRFSTIKTDVFQSLPLLSKIEEALKDYIENARPASSESRIFLMPYAPFAPISSIAIHGIYTKYLTQAEIDISNRKHGGHAFRASLTSAMVNNGMTYDEVREILGHFDPNAIKHYATLHIERLRLAALDPEDASGNFKKLLRGFKHD